MPTALITGISGQDGAYLAHFLLGKGYRVWGTIREPKQEEYSTLRALGIQEAVTLVPADFTDLNSLARAVSMAAPDEVYNLAAQSSVAASFEFPLLTGEITGLGAARLLQAVREVRPQARFYQAGSSDMFGAARETPQTETTPFYPRSPYAAAKVYAHWMTVNYREAFGLHANCGILYNHESPLRPDTFVTRKVTKAAARIKYDLQGTLDLGNLDVERDWGFAGDYVEAMYLMLQQHDPGNFIIATGKTHSLRQFVDCAFACLGLDYRQYVRVDPAFFRPAEVNAVVGCNDKAVTQLGWKPRLQFEELVEFLVEAEVKRVLGEEKSIRYLP